MAELPDVGIFGTGRPTEVLVPLLRSEGFHIEALWGHNQEEARVVAEKLAIPFSTDHVDDVLLRKDVDLIIILCPPSFHSEIAVKALGIGKHVTVQCPGGLNQEESMRMVQAAQYYPRLLSTLHTGMRFLPAMVKAKSLIDSGHLGQEIWMCEVRLSVHNLVGNKYTWTCDGTMGGGVLHQFGTQIIDLLNFLTNQRPIRVNGTVRTLAKTTEHICGIRNISSDDWVSFQMEMSGGAFANVTLNSQLQGFSQEVYLVGPEGRLIIRNGDLFSSKGNDNKEELLYEDDHQSETNSDPLFSGIYLKGLVQQFRSLAKRFSTASSGLSLDESMAGFEDAQCVQAVCQAIKESSRERHWTKVMIKTKEESPVLPLQHMLHLIPRISSSR